MVRLAHPLIRRHLLLEGEKGGCLFRGTIFVRERSPQPFLTTMVPCIGYRISWWKRNSN